MLVEYRSYYPFQIESFIPVIESIVESEKELILNDSHVAEDKSFCSLLMISSFAVVQLKTLYELSMKSKKDFDSANGRLSNRILEVQKGLIQISERIFGNNTLLKEDFIKELDNYIPNGNWSEIILLQSVMNKVITQFKSHLLNLNLNAIQLSPVLEKFKKNIEIFLVMDRQFSVQTRSQKGIVLIFVHPVNGFTFCYQSFLQYQRFSLFDRVFLTDPSIDGVEDKAFDSVADQALDYEQRVRRKFNCGPFAIIGYSSAGIIGLEMAGNMPDVRHVFLLDTWGRNPKFTQNESEFKSFVTSGKIHDPTLAKMREVSWSRMQILNQHRPVVSKDLKVTLFKATDPDLEPEKFLKDEFNFWKNEETFIENLEMMSVSGSHETFLKPIKPDFAATLFSSFLNTLEPIEFSRWLISSKEIILIGEEEEERWKGVVKWMEKNGDLFKKLINKA